MLRRLVSAAAGAIAVALALEFSFVEIARAGSSHACGDSKVEKAEECDDGNEASGDGCSYPSCLPEVCGDDILNPDPPPGPAEQCDDGNDTGGDGCDSNCKIECGNGVTDEGESCDTSGESATCDDDCTSVVCGDDNRNQSAGEQCDDGNTSAGDGCAPNCTLPGCGNGFPEDDEACDTGGESAACDEDCTLVACGDDEVNQAAGEHCDDNNRVSGDGCDANCSLTQCGNGIVTDGEACDDGNQLGGDKCSADCEVNRQQSKNQTRCITATNKSVGGIARAQGRLNLRCLKAAAADRLGDLASSPASLEACFEADPGGKVSAAQSKLDRAQVRSCFVNDLPDLALLNPLAGREPAAEIPIATAGVLFGAPAEVVPNFNRPAARCQLRALATGQAHFDTLWKVAVKAKSTALAGKESAPARSNEELAAAVAEAIRSSVEAQGPGLSKAIGKACLSVPGLDVVFSGCQPKNPLELAACVQRATRCGVCQLLRASDPLIPLECDLLDDEVPNFSCE